MEVSGVEPMTDETPLELARQALDGHSPFAERIALRAILAHLEQQQPVQAPEAAPERATRVWREMKTAGWCLECQAEVPFAASHSMQTKHHTTKEQPKPLSPSAVQGEERTARLVKALEKIASKHGMTDARFRGEALHIARAALGEWNAAASSSPTATAQRGEETAHGICTCLSGEYCIGSLNCRLPVPDPLPAQTEPGERITLGEARERAIASLMRAEEERKDAAMREALDDWSQPPSPAPECAHEPDWDLWNSRNRYRAGVELAGQLALTVACRRCEENLTFPITAPSLPTEGEGP